MNFDNIPRLPLGEWIESGLDFLTDHGADFTLALSRLMRSNIGHLNDALLWVPPWAVIIVVALGCWRFSGFRLGLFALLGLGLIWNIELWVPMMESLSLVVIATLISVIIALPVGMLAALFKGVNRVVMPVLDFMQTMPAFVYLIPAIPFFGIGEMSAIFATIIFSMPPAIRFTILGIQQVPEDLVEGADAFGSTRGQKLFKLQLPLAWPTIMAGINQTIMLALSMVVIAAMVGANGLGKEVYGAIQRLEPGAGFEAGIAVVILAILLDRITQSFKGHQRQ